MRLLGWDCPEECKYECMWKTTELFKEKTDSVPQFYGKVMNCQFANKFCKVSCPSLCFAFFCGVAAHVTAVDITFFSWHPQCLIYKQLDCYFILYSQWPFVRFLGIQEPASALFSLFNGMAHVAGFLNIQKRVAPGAPLRNWWLAFSLLSIVCWIFSTIFHTRDTYLTERLDYAGGMVVNVAALAGLAMRLIGPKRMTGWVEWQSCCVMAEGLHFTVGGSNFRKFWLKMPRW